MAIAACTRALGEYLLRAPRTFTHIGEYLLRAPHSFTQQCREALRVLCEVPKHCAPVPRANASYGKEAFQGGYEASPDRREAM